VLVAVNDVFPPTQIVALGVGVITIGSGVISTVKLSIKKSTSAPPSDAPSTPLKAKRIV
jgi:hypothetical protein